MQHSPDNRAGSPFGSRRAKSEPSVNRPSKTKLTPVPKADVVTVGEFADLIGRSPCTIRRRDAFSSAERKAGVKTEAVPFPERIQDGGNPTLWNRADALEYAHKIGIKPITEVG